MQRKEVVLGVAFLMCLFMTLSGRSSRADLVVKIGYVDVQKVFEGYQRKKDLEMKLRSEQEKARQSLEEKRKEIEALKEELIKQEMLLSESAKAEKEKELQDKTRELQEFVQSVQKQIQGKQDLYTQQIMDDIEAVVKEIAQKEGYRLIFRKEALLYATPELEFDLTEKVLSLLNQKYRPEQ